MKPTAEYLQERFRKYNEMCFGGGLAEVPISVGRSRTYLGQCLYKRQRKLFGGEQYYDFRIRISAAVDLPEDELDDILIHEMIHYSILSRGIKDTSAHGRLFRGMMSDINGRFGRHITVSHKFTPEDREKLYDTRSRAHIVSIVSLKDGRTGIKVLPADESRASLWRRRMLRTGRIASLEMHPTDDPYFNRFPCSTAQNVVFTDMGLVYKHLE